jgi:hypothetical protein
LRDNKEELFTSSLDAVLDDKKIKNKFKLPLKFQLGFCCAIIKLITQ